RLHPLHLQVVGRDQELAAGLEGNVVLATELLRRLGPFPAQPGLQRSRLIVDAGMDDAAVVPGLVTPEAVLLLKEDDLGASVAGSQRQRRCQADDTAPDDTVLVIHLPCLCGCRPGACRSGCLAIRSDLLLVRRDLV